MSPETDRPVPCSAAPELFFPPDGERVGSAEQMSRVWTAQQYCRHCPIVDWCRDQPAPTEPGVWGGVDEHARSKAMGVRYRPDRLPRARVPAQCGTTGGAAKHRRLKQRVCEACSEADRVDRANRRARQARPAA